jgi:hypothetical protein
MSSTPKLAKPRILLVTPEITYLPPGMGNLAHRMSAKAGGLADVSASLVSALFELGADVHVAMPHYRRMFNRNVFNHHEQELEKFSKVLPDTHIHLAEDRIFYYRERVYSASSDEAMRIALVFQREVINHIMPRVQPDLIHCNDWMTALVPAAARRAGIKSLFTVHNIHTRQVTLGEMEDTGIDAASFWMNLYFSGAPNGYEHARSHVPVDMLASGIFAAHFINTVSPRFLWEIVEGWHSVVPDPVRAELRHKFAANCSAGILNAPDPSYNPAPMTRWSLILPITISVLAKPPTSWLCNANCNSPRIPTPRSSSGPPGSIQCKRDRSSSPTSFSRSSPTTGTATCRWSSSPTAPTNTISTTSLMPSTSKTGWPSRTSMNGFRDSPMPARITC